MTSRHPVRFLPEAGFSMLEILVTLVILAFGLLGLAALQTHIQSSETESFQRAQAILLAEDMANRLSANRTNAASYVTAATSPLGTGDAQPTDCTASATVAALDQCEWSNELKGASELIGTTTPLGAMKDARGCIDLISPAGSSTPVYLVSVAWQGMATLKEPSLACARDMYGGDAYRRAFAISVPIATLSP